MYDDHDDDSSSSAVPFFFATGCRWRPGGERGAAAPAVRPYVCVVMENNAKEHPTRRGIDVPVLVQYQVPVPVCPFIGTHVRRAERRAGGRGPHTRRESTSGNLS